MAFFRLVPNLTIMAPKDFKELEDMLEFSVGLKKPVLIRYPRGGEELAFENHSKIELGKAEVIREGNNDITIFAIGKMVARAEKVAEELEKNGIYASVVNMRFLKPLDEKTVIKYLKESNKAISIEDGTVINGLGALIEQLIAENDIDIEFIKYAYPDEFVKHGSVDEIEKKYGLDVGSIVECLKKQEKDIKMMNLGT